MSDHAQQTPAAATAAGSSATVVVSAQAEAPVYRMQLQPRARVTFDASAVDNEHLGRKKSNSTSVRHGSGALRYSETLTLDEPHAAAECCIFHKKRAFDESSSESGEDSSDDDDGGARPSQRRHRHHKNCSHDDKHAGGDDAKAE